MKDVQKELIAISTTLSSLVKQIEKMAKAIEKGSGKAAPAKKAKAVKKAKSPAKKIKATAKKAKAAPKKKAAKAAKKAAPAAAGTKTPATAGGQTMLEGILGMISRSRNGITVERLKKRTGFEARQVSNALYKLTQKAKIETLSRGVYIKKKK